LSVFDDEATYSGIGVGQVESLVSFSQSLAHPMLVCLEIP